MKSHHRQVVVLGLSIMALAAWTSARAQNPDAASDTDKYIAPEGKAPPVAPPLRKGSPLDHLANDPKLVSPQVGYREGNTNGSIYWVAHRFPDDMDGQGWGWIRRQNEDWGDGIWIALQETPGLAVAPRRKLTSPTGDVNWEFKFWGSLAPYKAYDPRTDELLPVFVLQGYEVLGPAQPLRNKIGPPGRVLHRPSGASSRNANPIISDHPGVD